MNESNFSYDTSPNVTLSVVPQYITVDKTDWNRLKREVNRCKHQIDWWMNIAFAFFGIAGSAFITWLSLPNEIENERAQTVLMCTAIACFVIGFVSLFAHFSFVGHYTADIDDVKQVVTDIEDKLPTEK